MTQQRPDGRPGHALWIGAGLILLMPAPAVAHDEALHCEAVAASVAAAGFADDVTVTCRDGQAFLTSDTYPDHPLMTGIVGTNEQVPVPAPGYAAPVVLAPALTDIPHTRDAALGVAVNGVPIYDYTAGGEMSLNDLAVHQTDLDTVITGQLDICGGHAGRGDDYHYHTTPTCMIEQMPNAGPAAILGWAHDGYPIYGDTNPDGSVIAEGALDICNGQPDPTFGYRYHTSSEAPYIVQCLWGDLSTLDALPRVSPLRAAAGGAGLEPGRPPRGGVADLVFVEDAGGAREMTYTYQGEGYYIRYAPSGTPGCYEFETRTVTAGGAVQTAELCR